MAEARHRDLAVALLIAATSLPALSHAQHAAPNAHAQDLFGSLRSAIREALPRGGNGEGSLTESKRDRLLDLRAQLADVRRRELSKANWLDLHIMLQAIDRRLSQPPKRAGRDDEPCGRPWFDWKLRHGHQLDLSAADLELLGEQAYAQTLRQLRLQAARIDPERSWQELSRRARRDAPRNAAELLPMCRELSLEAWRFAEDSGFVSVPEVALDLGVREGKERGDKPFAWYQPGRLEDGFYVGTYMVTPVPTDLDPLELDQLLGDVNVHWMRVVSLHEAIPGHHLQFAIASMVDSPVRGWGYTSVFVEGWGLYCEEAMHRHGFYSNPLTRLEQLRMRLWRAARVIIDARIHTRGMTRQLAIDLLVNGVLMARDNAAREVDRYLHSPTQPMSYIIGMTQIEQMRRRAQARARGSWDERAFHDELLAYGPAPFDLLSAIILDERDRYDRDHP